ncbi:Cytochrome C oxidase, cbb3-type, subunit III [Meinhardsimonia xiamenensis]|jgi:mono/diheme cytochrome c family protein|uniref:Cytochrome C oxidase, cbb3-type, subunit III n=1 Tax=Meinhardsimonia xiamenensis TaxID=990712 RepID=A0A1G9BBB9_9RHOB|nr:cytochrome c [Meinhardsimonia xiamenensis]PRX35044.1 cbb3-type cytochrome c oxidase subunit III [Meinhardsimonia xiamenensis]SDK36771.1 Cytochrome C oxidase, cbb3-type, subunit III [Meinhardsimonia xiamenensis]
MKRMIPMALAALLLGGASIFFLRPETDGAPVAVSGAAAQASQAAPLVEVALPERLSPEAQMGKRAFDAFCARCHGQNAAGQEGVAPPLVHRIYEPGHHGDMAFMLAARNGVRAHHWRFGDMPPVEGITDAEIRAIITYVRELQRANGIF